MSKFKTGWYILYTRPRHEKTVARRLSEIDVRYYLPTAKSLRVWCDRKRFVDLPLFPSYIFVFLESPEQFNNGLDIDGVLHYVRFGKEIASVSDTVISNIQLIVENGQDLEVSLDYIKPGQQLCIQRGPLTGLCGEIVRVNGSQKILVRVNLLQRNLLITLPAEDLMAISA